MAPFWPFKRGSKEPDQLDEAPPAPVVYKMGQEKHAETLADQSHKTSSDYTSALSLLGGGNTEVQKAEDVTSQYDGVVSGSTTQSSAEVASHPPPPSPPQAPATQEPEFEWIDHSDGYSYKKLPDGSFDPTAYVKDADGNYTPYS